MTDREDFLAWFKTTWLEGEVALHDGDAGPRFGTWSQREPVTLFGAWFTATDAQSSRQVFTKLAQTFSRATSNDIELIAAEVSGDMAYTVQREITSADIDGEPRTYALRVTQVYRREEDGWKVVHRHGDEEPPAASTG